MVKLVPYVSLLNPWDKGESGDRGSRAPSRFGGQGTLRSMMSPPAGTT